MPTEEELIKERVRKLGELRKLGIEAYPYSYDRKHSSAEVNHQYAKLKPDARTKDKAKVAGRIVGLRRIGKLTFCHLLDEFGKVQLMFREEKLGSKEYDRLKYLDIGDWLGAEGVVIKTKTGEVTVEAAKYLLLCKSLRPLPEKWHGLKDIELRYRQRYVDLVMNPEVRDVFVKRTQIINTIREVLNARKYTEVETPVLQPVYGGAAARPFKSFLHDLKMNVYLRISNELYLKRLIVGGFERVYEFAKDFRNESIDRTHNPEFSMIEMYQAYADFNDMMKLTEEIYASCAKKVCSGYKIEYQGQKINLKPPWPRMKMTEAIRKFADINVEKLDDRELKDLRLTYNLEIEGELTRGKIIQALFDELVEGKLIQPVFITHHPVESTPLCKPARDEARYVERFEPFIIGMEMGNAYSELNDPLLQRKLLEEQSKELKKGVEQAHPMDEDFLRAIEIGMPPTGGLGLGIDRMVMLLANQASIRDVIFFPFMK